MSLKERITDDMKTAMRAKDAARLLTIRGLLAAMMQREVDERIELDDTAVIAIVDKLVKQRKDSITSSPPAGGRTWSSKEAAELQVLEGYLPEAPGCGRDRRGDRRRGHRDRSQRPGRHGQGDGRRQGTSGRARADMGAVSAAVKPRWPGEAAMTLQIQRLDTDFAVLASARARGDGRGRRGGLSQVSSTTVPISRAARPSRPARRWRKRLAPPASSTRTCPVAGNYQSPEEIARFAELLASLPKPVLAFCRSGTRSGRLWQLATGH